MVDAVVILPEKQVYGIYKLDSGKQIIATTPLTPDELEDYRRHPDTFFGIYRKQGHNIDNLVDLFDFFYESHKDNPRERLLEFMKDAPDLEELKHLSRKDLAEVVCERWAYNAGISE